MATNQAFASVPRWSEETLEDIGLDKLASHYFVVATDEQSRDHIGDQVSLLRGISWELIMIVDEEECHDHARSLVSRAKTGDRFLVVGRNPLLGRIHSMLMKHGALTSEVITIALDVRDGFDTFVRDVLCIHCHSLVTERSAIGDTITCATCHRPLTIYHHYSVVHHAYLGYQADSEDLS